MFTTRQSTQVCFQELTKECLDPVDKFRSLEMSVPMFVGSPVDVGRVEELIIGQEDKQDELLVNPETHFRLELED